MVYPYFDHPSSHTLCKGLVERGCKLTVFCCPHENEKNLEGVKIIHTPYLFKLRPYFPISIPKRLSFEKFDILHLHEDYQLNTFYCSFLSRNKANIPTILTEHYDGYAIGHTGWKLLRSLTNRFIGKTVVRGCDRYIAQTTKSREYLINQGAEPKFIDILYHSVDTSLFTPRRSNVLNKYLSDDEIKFLFVGRLEKSKGVYSLIHAMKYISKSKLNAKLFIIGRGGEEKNLKTLVSSLNLTDFVKFLGNISYESLPEFYNSCDVLLLPSLIDPSPSVILEAMACGKPVIGSKVGGIKEVLVDRETGYLFTPNNYRELSLLLRKFIESPNIIQQFGKNSRKRIEEVYALDKISEKQIKIYEKVLAKN
ncbi:MAG: glycosyltransferase family 4 protein [Promethearchaeota archaeon]